MTWNDYYQTSDKNTWQGRSDLPPKSCFFQIVECLTMDTIANVKLNADHMNFALIGFCCDEGIQRNQGRLGAAEAPQSIRKALAKLPIHKATIKLFDVGNIICKDHNLEAAQTALSEVVALILTHHFIPIVLGGGHEVAWGHFQGIAKIKKSQKLAIANFDAHLDMRPLLQNNQGSSGTPFLQMAKYHEAHQLPFDYSCIGLQQTSNIDLLLETAKKYAVHTLLADDLHLNHVGMVEDFINRIIDQNELIYVSLCMDVIAAAFAPGVSAPQPLGLLPWQIIPLVRALASSEKVVSFDIAELSPVNDHGDITAKLAASMIYEFTHHYHKNKD